MVLLGSERSQPCHTEEIWKEETQYQRKIGRKSLRVMLCLAWYQHKINSVPQIIPVQPGLKSDPDPLPPHSFLPLSVWPVRIYSVMWFPISFLPRNKLFFFSLSCAGSSLLHGIFSSCDESKRALLCIAVHGLVIAVASLVTEHRCQGTRASVVAVPGL